MICEIDGLVLGGVQFGVLFEVLMAVRAHLFKIDGGVLEGMQCGVLVQVLFWGVTVPAYFCILTVGCRGGGAVWGAGAAGAVGGSLWGAV